MPFTERLNRKDDGHLITDEKFTLASDRIYKLAHHNLINNAQLEVWTGVGKTGTQITDFTIGQNVDKTWVYELTFGAGVALGDYYVTYQSQGDKNDADDLNDIYALASIRGEKFITRYVHSANPEYHIESVDWATGIITLTQPHGLSANTQVLVTPNYCGLDNPQRDIRSIPMEWIKPQGVTTSANNTGLGFVVIDETSVKLVRSSDYTTALTVNTTSLENNNNIDITKFHFETIAGWSITNLPHLKKFKVRTIGYIKFMGTNGALYRYTGVNLDYEDGTTGSTPYINFLGLPTISNSNAGAGTWLHQDWIIDLTSQQMSVEFSNLHFGRRAGYNTLVWDGASESVVMPKRFYSISKPFKGAVSFYSWSGASYAYLANGCIIEIWDIGVTM